MSDRTIFIGADHQGWELKEKLASWLREKNYHVHDKSAAEKIDGDDYPPIARGVAQAVIEQGSGRFGILVCGSGAGMAIAANKVTGIRAALIHDPKLAAAARHDDDINIVALGAAFITFEQAQAVVEQCLATSFSPEERYQRRLTQIKELEH